MSSFELGADCMPESSPSCFDASSVGRGRRPRPIGCSATSSGPRSEPTAIDTPELARAPRGLVDTGAVHWLEKIDLPGVPWADLEPPPPVGLAGIFG